MNFIQGLLPTLLSGEEGTEFPGEHARKTRFSRQILRLKICRNMIDYTGALFNSPSQLASSLKITFLLIITQPLIGIIDMLWIKDNSEQNLILQIFHHVLSENLPKHVIYDQNFQVAYPRFLVLPCFKRSLIENCLCRRDVEKIH